MVTSGKKNINFLVFFAMLSKLQLIVGILISDNLDYQILIVLIPLLLQFLLLIFFVNFCFESKFGPIFRGEADLSIKLAKNYIYLALCVTGLLYLFAGAPLISDDPNASKVGLSNYALIMRFLRVILPVSIFSLTYLTFIENRKIKENKLIIIFSVILLLLSGFKGYLFVYLVVPIVIAYLIAGDITWNSRLLTLIILLATSLLMIVMFNESLDAVGALNFLVYRLTSAVSIS